MTDWATITQSVERIVTEVADAGKLGPGRMLVIGTSTSEVAGKRIGTSGGRDAAQAIFAAVEKIRREAGFDVAFQCCEHLNRALVVERAWAAKNPELDIVAAVPIPKAGGSMAAYAFRHLDGACLVESIQADAGVDIGETLIGMHLRRVAVPFRPSLRYVGEARVNAAITRPKLIGGIRAVYELEPEETPDTTC